MLYNTGLLIIMSLTSSWEVLMQYHSRHLQSPSKTARCIQILLPYPMRLCRWRKCLRKFVDPLNVTYKVHTLAVADQRREEDRIAVWFQHVVAIEQS
jgi:hypothetical protein